MSLRAIEAPRVRREIDAAHCVRRCLRQIALELAEVPPSPGEAKAFEIARALCAAPHRTSESRRLERALFRRLITILASSDCARNVRGPFSCFDVRR